MATNCIDVSSYQGTIDWTKVKTAGVQYACLRSVVKNLATDSQFETNYKNAKAAGIKVGVYVYAYATNVTYAKQEANAVISLLAKRSLDLPIFYDLESSTLRSASKETVQEIASAFQTIVENAGYKFGIYCDSSFYSTNSHFSGYDSNCNFWIAAYGTNDGTQHTVPTISHHLCCHQFSSKGSINGISGNVDVNNWYGLTTTTTTNSNTGGTTMGYSRSVIVAQAQAWLGYNESDGTHKQIIDVYNAHTPLARSYKVQYTDAWCATFVSAVSIKCGYTAIIPTECSCSQMITLFKNLGEWKEDDSYTPSAGDIIFYDWQDSGSGDNTGTPDHVGIVEKVSGSTITVIEGNYSDSVKRRTIAVNGKYIRGYGLPAYTTAGTTTSSSSSSTTTTTTSSTSSSSSTALNKTEQWKGVVTASTLNVRTWAGTSNSTVSFSPLKKGAVVSVCDTVKASDGSSWYYIKYNSKYGFASASYISKQSTTTTTTSSTSSSSSTATSTKTATEKASSYDKSLAGTYKTTAKLNVRNGAGTGKSILVTIPKGTSVTNYGYYTTVSGIKWMYVQFTYNKVQYTGFCSKTYLTK